MPAALCIAIQRQISDEEGTRANETHITFENVDKLGKFIDGSGAYEFADGSKSLGIRKEVAVRIFAVIHRFEFDDLEDFFMLPGSRLSEKNTAPVGNSQQNHRPQDNG